MRPYIIFIILASFILAGCATTQTSKQVNVLSLPETQSAREYKANGQYEEAIEAYRQLIAAHPKHFNSVLYQHEIMEITESLSDPWRLMDEMNRTLALFETAKAEPFEGATPEAIQHEQDALDEYIIQKSAMYHNIYQTTHNRVYASFAVDLCELQMRYLSDSQCNCNMMYSCADLAYSIKRFDIAVNVYHKILESCEDEKLDDFPKSYVDAALGAVLAYDRLLFSDLCPDSPKKDDDDISEYPIAECR
ncbi:MAG: hypothetical protein J6X10_06920 [Bacteroidales bacterium]|nr:hypothetical protein [Bacteroidales bacterium]